MASQFSYEEAFSRNIGWLTERELQVLRGKRIAIAGMGGVGGAHLLTLVRLGIGAFHIADLDAFEAANFNRQTGATLSSLGRPKVEVLAEMARDINSDTLITCYSNGVDEGNLDDFLRGVDLYIDGLDFFVLGIRTRLFARCAELGIPAITAAPIGMGVAWLVFMPGCMSFEEYFHLDGLSSERQQVNFLVGLSPKGLHRPYLVDPSRVDLIGHRGPSTGMACQLCAAVAATDALKILLGRGPIRAAPRYQQFDPYLGKLARGWMPWGNHNPIQTLRRHIGYRMYARMSRSARPEEISIAASEIEQILDLARWAPSGDNAQPWRFEIKADDKIIVHARDEVGEDVYDYEGRPSMLSFGFLLESLRVAASRFGRAMNWSYQALAQHEHRLEVDFPRSEGVSEDSLLPYLTIRSVNRRRYRMTALTAEQKQELEACLGQEFQVRWFETFAERWRMARIMAMSTSIRLRIPECFPVHQRILDWEREFSTDGVPVKAVGVDAVTLNIMQRVMQSWSEMHFMNRFLGGTVLPRLELDWMPGLSSAAIFVVTRRESPPLDDERLSLLRAGQLLQRFWLSATRMGLVMQPLLAPLCFAHYGRHGIAFTKDASMAKKADALASRLEEALAGEDPESPLFMGRVGWPASRQQQARSLRRPLAELLLP